MTHATVFVSLFVVAVAVSILARRVRVPYTVALVVSGVVLGGLRLVEAPHLTKEFLYNVFLPGLVFEAAFGIELEHARRSKIAMVVLAVPGVFFAMVSTAGVLTVLVGAVAPTTELRFLHALVFAALIAATDPIAVVAMFKTLGAPRRLTVLVEGESLLNDGTAIVFFTLVRGFLDGTASSVAGAVVDFGYVVGVGVLVGYAIALVVCAVIRRIGDPMLVVTLTTIAAYGSFALAEQIHVSGVIATVVAGGVLGEHSRRQAMTRSTRRVVDSFWEYVAFALNSVVFLLIGFEVHVVQLLSAWRLILAAYVSVTVARALLVALVTLLLARTRERIPWRWSAVIAWGGLRGALSMVLVLALPVDLATRRTLISMTFGVVLVSLAVQGLTMSALLRRLGVVDDTRPGDKQARHRAERRAAQAALAALAEMVDSGDVRDPVADALRAEYREKIAEANRAIGDEPDADASP